MVEDPARASFRRKIMAAGGRCGSRSRSGRARTSWSSPAFATPTVSAPVLAAHPDARVVAPHLSAPEALMHHLGITDLRAGNVATHLGGDAHVLRFVATQDGKPVGGYTIIVRD
jgi:hypothetical protein